MATCQSCAPRWKKSNKPLVKMVKLPSGVFVCPFCDGPVVEIAEKAQKRKQKDDPPK